jgi:hypothetical protein
LLCWIGSTLFLAGDLEKHLKNLQLSQKMVE